jgi:hypothetical protein
MIAKISIYIYAHRQIDEITWDEMRLDYIRLDYDLALDWDLD